MENSRTHRIKCYQLNLEHLRSHPVWSWYEGTLFEDENLVAPVSLTEEALAQAGTLMIHAKFTLASGLSYEGSITYDVASDEVYAIDFWVAGFKYGFNARIADLGEEDANRLREQLGDPKLVVFPIRYSVLDNRLDIPDGDFNLIAHLSRSVESVVATSGRGSRSNSRSSAIAG